jgi:hypothetical protein
MGTAIFDSMLQQRKLALKANVESNLCYSSFNS